MKINKLLFLLFCFVSFCFVSCSNDDDNSDDGGIDVEIPEDFETNSKDSTFNNAILIKFDGDDVKIANPLKDRGITITNEKEHVVIRSTVIDEEVSYVLSGNTLDGSVRIYSDFKFELIMNGVSIINKSGPAINIQSGKKITVKLIETTSNRLVDSNTYADPINDEDQKATFFSEGQLVFEEKGSLLVYGLNGHAICSDDFVRIKEGNIKVEAAAKDGVHANDYIQIDGGTLNITATSQGIECEKGYISINGGNITIDSDKEGISVSYNGTDALITPYLEINGGNIYAYSKNNDGIESKGTVLINGGVIITSGNIFPRMGVDCSDRTFRMTGGTIVGTGGTTSLPTANVSSQYSVIYGASSTKDQLIHIESADGNSILTYKIPRLYPDLALLVSSPSLKANTEYKIYTGGSVSGGTNFNGLYTGATYTKGTEAATFTTETKVTIAGTLKTE